MGRLVVFNQVSLDGYFGGRGAMKIALIAMSGVRAYNEQLTRLGMTLPGFVEWFRWIPVPSRLAHPFSPGRWALIAIHVFLINFGLAVVGIAAFASTGRR